MNTIPPSPSASEGNQEYRVLLDRAREAIAAGREVRVPLSSMRPMPNQPRKHFSADALLRLGEAMLGIGQLQAGIIRKIPPEGEVLYEILDGERRWRAASAVSLDYYRATLIEIDDAAVPYLIAAVSNFNRENHTPTEISESITSMIKLGIPMTEIADLMGISVNWAYQMYGLQKLHPDVWDMLDPTLPKEKALSVTAAIQISKVDVSLQLELAIRVLHRTLSLAHLRQEALRVSRSAGIDVKGVIRSGRAPRKQWEIIRNSMNQLHRLAKDLYGILGEHGTDATLRGRPQVEIWTVLNGLDEARGNIKKCEDRINRLRPNDE